MTSRERNRPSYVERPARDTTDAALAWLAGGGSEPWFLWVHYQDPHGPYTAPGSQAPGYAPGDAPLPVGADDVGYGGIPRYQALPGQLRRHAAEAQGLRPRGPVPRAQYAGSPPGAKRLPARLLRRGLVRADRPPVPDTFEPLGDTPPELFYESFREQALALAEGGVDLFAIETMMIPDEAVLAIKAAKDAAGLPVMCSMTFQYNKAKGVDRTMWGTAAADAAAKLVEAGADIVGCNCGDGGPDRGPVILAEMRSVTPALLAAYPNAGIPKVVGDKTVYDLTPEAMAAAFPAIVTIAILIFITA